MHELAAALVRSGWEVTVITGFPNHPSGVVLGGYTKRWLQQETIDGVRVCRVWLATSPTRSFVARLATFASFTVFSAWRLLRLPRPDIVFAVLQPLSVGVVLPLIARLKGTRVVFNVQDLHPDAQIRAGMVKNPTVIRVLHWIERYAYRHCLAVTAICEPFRRHVIQHGGSPERTFVIANWIDTERVRPMPEQGAAFRAEIGLAPEHFVVLCAGTLGHASGAAVIVEAAALLRGHPRVRFLIVGEGPLVPELRQRIEEGRLDNVVLLPFQPEHKLAAMQSSGDVSLATVAAGFAEISVPSKVLAYLAAGRQVVASVPTESETARFLREAGVGVLSPPGDAAALAQTIATLAADAESVRSGGLKAREYALEHLSAPATLKRYDSLLRSLCQT